MLQISTTGSVKSKEIKSLTGVRGIAALYVALYHSMETSRIEQISPLQIFYNRGNISVDLFFVLSGFVMALSSKRMFEGKFSFDIYKTFLRRRFARIYPMYLIVICIGFAFENNFNGKFNFLVGLSLLSMVFANGMVLLHLWSVNAEWICYLLFPLFIYLIYQYKSSTWMVLLILLGTFSVVYGEKSIELIRASSANFAFPTNYIMLKCFGEYILGILAFKISKSWSKYNLITNSASVFVAALMIYLLFIPDTDVYIIVLMAPFIFLISIEETFVGSLLSSRVIYFLGEISYSLYLIHGFFLHGLKPIFYSEFGNLPYVSLLFNTVYLLVVIEVSYLCYTWVEIPAQKFINNYFNPKKFIDKSTVNI